MLARAGVPTCAIVLVCLACLGSTLYVSDANLSLKQDNHWQKLQQEESLYSDIKSIVASKTAKVLPVEAQARARELASIYRQEGKQEEAAALYRMLWDSDGNKPSFIPDALELASIYTDMGGFASAVETDQKILRYDRDRLPPSDPAIARDINNLGQCYYTAGCGTADPKLRKQYFVWAKEEYAAAQKLTGNIGSSERNKVDQKIIQLNQALVNMDLDNAQSGKSMEQSAMMTFGDRGR